MTTVNLTLKVQSEKQQAFIWDPNNSYCECTAPAEIPVVSQHAAKVKGIREKGKGKNCLYRRDSCWCREANIVMWILKNIFNFQSGNHNACFCVIFAHSYLVYSAAFGPAQRAFYPVLRFLRLEEWDLRVSSSGVAAPTPFWSGFVHIIFHTTNVDQEEMQVFITHILKDMAAPNQEQKWTESARERYCLQVHSLDPGTGGEALCGLSFSPVRRGAPRISYRLSRCEGRGERGQPWPRYVSRTT